MLDLTNKKVLVTGGSGMIGRHLVRLLKEKECDMIEAGIIDPVKVTKVALRNAASAAGTLIMTGYSILEV